MTPSSAVETGPPAWPLLLAATVTAVALTLLLYLWVPRFEPSGEVIVPLPPGGLAMSSTDAATPTRADVALPLPAASHLRIEAVAATRDIARQPAIWRQGRVVLLQVADDGRPRWNLPHVVLRLSGSHPERRFTETFAVEAGSASLLLRLEVLETTGDLDVRSVRIEPLGEAAGFRRSAAWLAGVWTLLAFGWSTWAIARFRAGARRIGLAWLVAVPVLVLSVLPPTTTAPLREGAARNVGVVADVATVVQGDEAGLSANLFALSKLGHVVAWLTIGALFLWARGRRPAVVAIGAAIGFGIVAELLQHFSPNRTPDMFDALLNGTCALAGALAMLGLLAIAARLRPARPT